MATGVYSMYVHVFNSIQLLLANVLLLCIYKYDQYRVVRVSLLCEVMKKYWGFEFMHYRSCLVKLTERTNFELFSFFLPLLMSLSICSSVNIL